MLFLPNDIVAFLFVTLFGCSHALCAHASSAEKPHKDILKKLILFAWTAGLAKSVTKFFRSNILFSLKQNEWPPMSLYFMCECSNVVCRFM